MNKFKENFLGLIKNENKKVKIIVAIGLVGIILILASSVVTPSEKNSTTNQEYSYDIYIKTLEKSLKTVLSSIDGVGECEIMITLENTKESVYATDFENKSDDTSVNQKDEYVIYKSSDGEAPILIMEYFPKVQGVTVVCSGGNNVAVKEKIIEAVTSLFNIPANRVAVSKLKD